MIKQTFERISVTVVFHYEPGELVVGDYSIAKVVGKAYVDDTGLHRDTDDSIYQGSLHGWKRRKDGTWGAQGDRYTYRTLADPELAETKAEMAAALSEAMGALLAKVVTLDILGSESPMFPLANYCKVEDASPPG